eukprot:548071-Rhodomonas_salina.1
MCKGVCATQSTHVFARQSTLFACLTLLPVGETASYHDEQNLTHLVSQGLWPSYDLFFLAHTSGFLLHSLPCAQDLSVGGKTADLLGSTWPTGTFAGLPPCKSLCDNSGLELPDNTFAGGLDLTGAGVGSLWDFDDFQASLSCHYGLCMFTRKEKLRLIAESDSDSETSASGRPGTRSRATA